ADRCNLEIEFGKYHFPTFTPPKEISLDDYLDELAYAGLNERLEGVTDPEVRKSYLERLEYELRVIKDMQFPGYFLVVADFINYAKRNGVPVGPGRGSSAGSLVAYALRITDLDPIRHVLLFERFLNPERKSMPDIDVDFCIRGRAQVIQYVKDKYGADRVAQIATFGTLKAKAAIKDVFADRSDEDGAAPARADQERSARENLDGSCSTFGGSGAPRFDARGRRGAVQSAAGRPLPAVRR
ncbi:MAG: polymerase alpha subunit, partial [Deltaproteobacteria bacterium]|nr:polymerase alpha subunit [Deltaproteobacteria bacterium]